MTRKDYIAIGSVLAGSFAMATPAEKGIVWVTTLSIADKFAQDNPRFDRGRFYDFVLGSPDPFESRPTGV
jgi:hypothetical protein